MSPLHTALDHYLKMRRGFGFKLKSQGRYLLHFVDYMEQQNATIITSSLVIDWVAKDAGPPTWPTRLGAVRNFARHVSITEPRTQIPPAGLFPLLRRPAPHLYSKTELGSLLEAMLALPPAKGLRRWTYYCVIGLITVTGLRFGEALRLKRGDVDLDQGLLTIRETKFGKSRIVPVHPTTAVVLQDYAARRDCHRQRCRSTHFFTGEHGGGLYQQNLHLVFCRVSRQIGLRSLEADKGPRIHDLRHSFAVATLLRWYRTGADVEQLLPALSTFLGHTHTRDTYWYLSACPELMEHASRRLEARWETLS